MADFTIKQHDTYPPLEAVLSDQDGVINLTTAANVKLILKAIAGSPIVLTCTIVTPAAGLVSYDWQTADTASVNQYQAEFQITWASGKITTVPNVGFYEIDVVADLGP